MLTECLTDHTTSKIEGPAESITLSDSHSVIEWCDLQNFTGAGYAGLVYDSPEAIRDYSVKGKWRIPINMHIGNMGLAQASGVPIITSPPSRTGGNIDNKRIGIGGKHWCNVGIL